MEIIAKKAELFLQKSDLTAVFIFQDQKKSSSSSSIIKTQVGKILVARMENDRFVGKANSVFLTHSENISVAKHLAVVGLGYAENFSTEVVRQATACVINLAKEIGAKNIAMPLLRANNEIASECARAMVEGARLADYVYDKFKKASNKSPKNLTIVCEDGRDLRAAQKGIGIGEAMARATMFARDLVNSPAQETHPERLVEIAREIVKKKSHLKVKVYDWSALKKMGAGGILGVGQGSEFPPYLVHLIYKPKQNCKKRIALVGKAVTFDSGGLSLKPADAMVNMKIDMAGAAAVLGAFSQIEKFSPNVEVHGIFAAVENMPSGHAIRPGDILTALDKKTIEVVNTDAEGRITLADSLVFACKQKPTYIVDIATLTGACMTALGEEVSGFMSNNDKLSALLEGVAKKSGEKVWSLPLEKNYRKLLKSNVADMQNLGNGWGGALTAGLFLEEFVCNIPWAHIDIAGPSFAERDIDPYTRKGATGHGTRMLLELILSM